jgi:eukaryotic-like serine/threonine-protein kinase
MDFGLARSLEQPGLTRAGALIGTPYYMSPEQAEGKPVDTRSDLFSAGIIFYQMLTGVIPFRADTILASLLKRTREAPPEPSKLNHEVPVSLSDIVTKCLQVDPASRYQSAADIVNDVEMAWKGAHTPSTAQSKAIGSAKQAWTSWLQRVPFKLLAVASVLLLAVVVGIQVLEWKSPPVAAPAKAAKAITVLVADFVNTTGEPVFDGTLEPMFNFAMEGASFVTSYNRAQARRLAGQLGYAADKLDESSARLISVREGLDIVVAGSLSRSGSEYRVSAKALDAKTGNTIATAEARASGREAVLAAMPDLAAPIRKALGDVSAGAKDESEAETFTASSLEAAHAYASGQDSMLNGNFEKAREAFSKAIGIDARFGRAYASMAVASLNLGMRQDGDKYFKLALSHLDRMTDRERYRTAAPTTSCRATSRSAWMSIRLW